MLSWLRDAWLFLMNFLKRLSNTEFNWFPVQLLSKAGYGLVNFGAVKKIIDQELPQSKLI